MIDIVAHRPGWRVEFRELAAALRRGLGDIALRIDHIGSTSVPGLCAKDIIDMQITVARLEGDAATALRNLGYARNPDVMVDHVPPGFSTSTAEWAKLLFREPAGQRRVNVHVRQAGMPNQRYPLLFRDYLVSHPSTAAAYGELKRRLAASLANEDDYPDVKDPATDLIYHAAEEWAFVSGWQPKSSDA